MSAIQKYKKRVKELEEENTKLRKQLRERNNPQELDPATGEKLAKIEEQIGSELTLFFFHQGDRMVQTIRYLMLDFGGRPMAGTHIGGALMEAYHDGLQQKKPEGFEET